MTLAQAMPNWTRLAAQYQRLASPQRPCAADVALYQEALRGHEARVLLLGVTPALAGLGTSLLAIDAMQEMIDALWIGDAQGRRAQMADWRALPCADHSRSAVIGDGALSAADADPALLMREFIRVLEPGGIVAIRCFCAPSTPERAEAIRVDVLEGRVADIHELKWRIAMQQATADPAHRVPVSHILAGFDDLFPDRRLFLEQTGWTADVFDFIDYYHGSSAVFRFLPEDQLVAALAHLGGDISLLRPTGYPLAAQCPIIVLRDIR